MIVCDDTIKIKQATDKGYIEMESGGVADLSYPSSSTRRGRVQGGGQICPTITTGNTDICKIDTVACAMRGRPSEDGSTEQQLEISDRTYANALTGVQKDSMICEPEFRIRKLTPRECYRLMGFDDESFDRAEQVNSNTQLYKQAGNSIVVDVLEAIFRNLLIDSRSVWLDELLEDK